MCPAGQFSEFLRLINLKILSTYEILTIMNDFFFFTSFHIASVCVCVCVWKLHASMKYSQKYRRQGNLMIYYFNFCNAAYKQNTSEWWTKGCILFFSQKINLGVTKNYRSTTLTSITAKVYNALLLNCIKPEVEIIFRKYQNRNRSTSLILTGGARGVMVIIVGNGHGDTSSNPGQGWLHFK